MLVIGIDGGGTKTRVEIRDGENRLLRRQTFGAFNLNSIGEDAFRSLLEQVFSQCGDMSRCAGLCVGAAGISNPRVGQILEEVLENLRYCGPRKLCGDQEIALRGAMDTPGLAVIAGTGSICFGRSETGETARSGGYGHLIDDWGSGYALGRDALSAAVRAVDGRGQGIRLLERIYDFLGISSPEELVRFVHSPNTQKSHIAALARLVLELAEQGDETALGILRREASELGCMVQAVQTRLKLSGCPIALLGGLFESDNPYSRIASQELRQYGTVQKPEHDALWGAAQMAWELSGIG